MESMPMTVFVGDCVWHYVLFIHTAILGSLIRMEVHSMIQDLVCELWRYIRKKGSQKEIQMNIDIHLGERHLHYEFGIRFTNDENFEKEFVEKLTELEEKIVYDITRYTLSNPKFKRISKI